jgi:hypothetical protein
MALDRVTQSENSFLVNLYKNNPVWVNYIPGYFNLLLIYNCSWLNNQTTLGGK